MSMDANKNFEIDQTQEIISKFEQYARLKQQMASLDAHIKSLQASIIEAMINDESDKKVFEFGEFSFRKLTKWTYPESVKQYEEMIDLFLQPHKAKLEGQKKEAELNGEAKAEITQTLVFKASKITDLNNTLTNK